MLKRAALGANKCAWDGRKVLCNDVMGKASLIPSLIRRAIKKGGEALCDKATF